jgi:signal peptidase I
VDGDAGGPGGSRPPKARSARLDGLKERAPRVHRFLTSRERRVVVAREVAVGALVVLLVLALLWGFTGQPLGRSPIVVVESGSMMHCSNGMPPHGRDCDAPFARLGTIDPGDLILVKDVDGAGDVDQAADGGRARYGGSGDVIVFRPDGQASTPVIHRALAYVQVNGDGTFTVAALGLERARDLDDPRLRELGLATGYADTLRDPRWNTLCGPVGPARSGFLTRGDNNAFADQGAHSSIARCPVKTEWILGEARGELPWLGLVKLYATDLPKGCPVLPYSTDAAKEGCNYHNAGGDTKALLVLAIGALVGGPYLYERLKRRQPDSP